MLSTSEVLNVALAHECVSFDVFDTLVLRNVPSPHDVFRMMYKKVSDVIPDVGCEEFATGRIEAEKRARQARGCVEVTLQDIYQHFHLARGFEAELMGAEIETEVSVSSPNLDMRHILNSCVDNGKRVVLTSDMYLPREAVEQILTKCGIEGYWYLFLSSEWGVTKRDGRLFDELARAVDVPVSEIVHIGDSARSDYLIPRMKGIHALIALREDENRLSSSSVKSGEGLDARCLLSAAQNTCNCMESAFYKFGYAYFGIFLFGYCNWLKDEFARNEIKKAFFFSRDGLIVKQAFDILNDESIESCYLEVSRRSLRVPVLWMDDSVDAILAMISPSHLISLRSIFDCVGLNIEDHHDLLAELNLDEEATFDRKSIGGDDTFLELLNRLKPAYIERSLQEYEALKAYLSQNNVGGRFAVVDIGWSGGMQRYLSQVLDSLKIAHEISGYYTGVVAYARRNTSVLPLDLHGYVFNCLNGDKDPRRFFVGLFEALFLERSGSVSHYEVASTGESRAIRLPYEYECSEGLLPEAKCVEDIQRGALQFVTTVAKDPFLSALSITPSEAFSHIERIGNHPSSQYLDMFSNFRFFDDGECNYLAHPMGLLGYLRRPVSFKNDLLRSRWKCGFLSRLFHGAPLPYEKALYAIARAKEF